jgi:hypothetical protein
MLCALLDCEAGSSVQCVATGDRGSIPGRGERVFPLASLGPTQAPV